MKKQPKILKYLTEFAEIIQVPLYWFDTNNVVLGGNEAILKAIGGSSVVDFIGKTPYDYYPHEMADNIVRSNNEIMKTGKSIIQEEPIRDVTTGEIKYFTAFKAPLRDDDGIIIGTIGTSIEITAEKEAARLKLEAELQEAKYQEQLKFRKIVDQAAHDTKSPMAILLILAQNCAGLTKEKMFDTLKTTAAFIPLNIYWYDANNKVVGGNKYILKMIGGKSIEDFIGKTPYEYYPYEMADNIVRHNNEIMSTGKILSQEEPIRDVTTGKIKYFIAFKAPLSDNTGKVVGVIGISVDITAEKDAERLKRENELQKARLEEQEGFRKVADQVVHDIRSPLASLLMTVKAYEGDIPESARIALREAATGIGDIANNLLDKYRKDEFKNSNTEEQQPIMVSLALFQIVSDKKSQYKELPIKFIHNFCPECNFTFIKAEFTSFKRMMSNLINNAVDALEDDMEGIIELKLNMYEHKLVITILDSGKGMSQEIIAKILSRITVTSSKQNGYGIGFTQIMGTLERNQGTIDINSKVGKGTEITITFPIIDQPAWIAKEIELNKSDIVLVLDDDNSIHHAWDARFKKLFRCCFEAFYLRRRSYRLY